MSTALFGSEIWTARGEVFAVFFGLFARLALTEPSVRKQSGVGGLALRPFAAGLLASTPASASMVAFVLLVLSSVLYDGLLTTPEWTRAEQQLVGLMPGLGELASVVVRTIGIVAFWAAFLAAYLAVSTIMSAAAGHRSPRDIAAIISPRMALTMFSTSRWYRWGFCPEIRWTSSDLIICSPRKRCLPVEPARRRKNSSVRVGRVPKS